MSKVSIEFGHIYTDDNLYVDNYMSSYPNAHTLNRELTTYEKACAFAGNRAADVAKDLGIEAVKHLLIDDVEWAFRQRQSMDDHWRWQLFRNRAILGAQKAYDIAGLTSVESEGDLAIAAVKNLQKLREKVGNGGSHIRLQTRTGDQRVRLTGYRAIEDKEHPSCDILDLTWHQKRGKDTAILLTVLPKGYISQQARVHALAELLAGEPLNKVSAATLLLDDVGDPSQLVRWTERSSEATRYFDLLQSSLINDELNGAMRGE